MTKMTMHHITAIAHAELFLQPAIEKAPEKRFADQLTRDLERLTEVKDFIAFGIANPKLAFMYQHET